MGRIVAVLLSVLALGETSWQQHQQGGSRVRVETRLHPSHAAPQPDLGPVPFAVDSRVTDTRKAASPAGVDPGLVEPAPALADAQQPAQPLEPTTESPEALQLLLKNNPGMHVLNERVIRDVFDGRSNEVVCTFCLLQVFTVAYQLGNGKVRAEIETALRSEEPDRLGETLFNLASAANETLSGTLKGYYQRGQLASCDKQPEAAATAASGRRGGRMDHVRCEGIQQFLADVGRVVDFRRPETTQAINQEVAQATGGKIRDLFASLDPATQLVFAAALVFGDKWQARMATGVGEFRTPQGTISADTVYMSQYLPLLDGTQDGVVGVSLPYQHDDIRMFVFTTAAESGDIRRLLNRTHYAELAARSAPERRDHVYTRVEMPSYDIASKKLAYIDLATAMGMGEMFKGGLGADDQLKVDQLVHKAVIKTDRDGTEAAGAAGIALVPLSSKPTPFQAVFDRPFICSLVHMQTGVPLFTASIVDPRRK